MGGSSVAHFLWYWSLLRSSKEQSKKHKELSLI